MLKRSGAGRQRVWNALLVAQSPQPTGGLAKIARASPSSVRVYLSGLAKHGLAERDETGWTIRKTGPLAPAYSAQTGQARDWNTDPPMSPAVLETAWRDHGGSLGQFVRALGIPGHRVTKIRQMLSGQRPVTSYVEAAVRTWRDHPS